MMNAYALEAFSMSIKYIWQPCKGKTIDCHKGTPYFLENHYPELKSPFITKTTVTSSLHDAQDATLRINENVKIKVS